MFVPGDSLVREGNQAHFGRLTPLVKRKQARKGCHCDNVTLFSQPTATLHKAVMLKHHAARATVRTGPIFVKNTRSHMNITEYCPPLEYSRQFATAHHSVESSLKGGFSSFR